MTGYRTELTKPAGIGDPDRWEDWLSALDRVLSPAGPWAVGGGHENPERLQLALCELRNDPYAARTARSFTTATLHGWGLGDLLDDAELVIGELVINALRHGLSSRAAVLSSHPVRIILALTDQSLICVVTDPSDERPTPREPDFGAEGGRGLQVVAGISHRWGWAPLRSPGKAVWAGFTLGGSLPVRHLEICH
ncbi:ATP-binding protein [Sphaerisporangium fuscum]|uniref:ATP-binding protein n=1 Tax=Sphaerisporangium fuscum TaxID=2835868 RepID=UPI001BDCDCFE|nr:ATP-binding protein [Sphaerisporangium fuscum]